MADMQCCNPQHAVSPGTDSAAEGALTARSSGPWVIKPTFLRLRNPPSLLNRAASIPGAVPRRLQPPAILRVWHLVLTTAGQDRWQVRLVHQGRLL